MIGTVFLTIMLLIVSMSFGVMIYEVYQTVLKKRND